MNMILKKLVFGVTVITLPVALGACHSSSHSQHDAPIERNVALDLKATALKAQDALFKDYDAAAVSQYFKADYIQHNPNVPTGIEPIIGFLPALQAAETSVTTHRVLQDGPFIILHNSYNNAEAFGGKELVAFDVWRMEDGKVAEHWDNLQALVKDTASGRSQTDGPTLITDVENTETNKSIIRNFANDILLGNNPSKITDYISTTQYHQHNPMVKDGLEGFGEAVAYLESQGDMFRYSKVHRILGEGNFVLAMSEGTWHDKPHAFYDLFRLENGKIVEHWDVISEIPSEMAHSNGKF